MRAVGEGGGIEPEQKEVRAAPGPFRSRID